MRFSHCSKLLLSFCLRFRLKFGTALLAITIPGSVTATAQSLILDTSGTTIITSATSSENTWIGVDNGGVALKITGSGSLSGSTGTIGMNADSDGNRLELDGVSASYQNSGDLNLGYVGAQNRVILDNGATLSVGALKVGGFSQSTGNAILIHSGTLTATDYISLGYDSSLNSLTLENGLISSVNGFLGRTATSSSNSVLLTGSNASWVNSDVFYIGQEGSGNEMTISAGAQVLNGADFVIGSGSQANRNSTTVTGAGSLLSSTGSVIIGDRGSDNTLYIQDGASVSSVRGRLGVYLTSTNNNVVISGSSSRWDISTTLRVGGSGSGSIDVSAGGALYVAGNAFVGYSPGTSNDNSITVSGSDSSFSSGTLIIGRSGTQNYVSVEDGATLSSGSVILGDRSGAYGELRVSGGALVNTGTITSGSGSGLVSIESNQLLYTFNPVMTGNISLVHSGSGTTLITGSNSYTGETRINAGGLIINGSVLGDVTVSGGFLGGSGLIGGNVINDAIVSPGNSPGTLTINGNYTQSGLLQIEISGTGAGQYDRLVIGGTAQLGGTLVLKAVGGFRLGVGLQLLFLDAATVSGSFSSIQTDTILKGLVLYSSSSSMLQIVQGSFQDLVGLTRNQRSVAAALDSAVGHLGSQAMIDYLNGRSLSELPGDLDKIAPEELTSIFTLSINQAQTQSINLQRRTDDLRAGVSGFSSAGLSISQPSGKEVIGDGKELISAPAQSDGRRGAFVTGVGERMDVGASNEVHGFDLSTAGIHAGMDYRFGPGFAAGLTAGYANSDADLSGGGDLSVNGGKLGLYATAFENGWYLDGALIGGRNSYESKRSSLQGYARGKTDGAELNALLGTGYQWRMKGLRFGPTAEVNYSSIWMDGFEENGSLAPLRIDSRRVESLRSTLGALAVYERKVANVMLRPEVRAAWRHEFADNVYDLNSSFASGAGENFLVSGPKIGRDSFQYGMGCAVQWSATLSSYLFYDGEIGSGNANSHSLSLGVRVGF